jgi:hypothetical protein
MYFAAQAVKPAETHDQRPPLVGVDVIQCAVSHQSFVNVGSRNANFECPTTGSLVGAVPERVSSL